MWFKRMWCDEYGTTNYIGRPELPVLRELLAIPGGVDVDVEVMNFHYETFENYHIYPLQPPYPIGYEGPIEFDYDEKFYQTNEYYPPEPAEVGDQGYMKDFYTMGGIMNPFRYIPIFDVMNVNYEFDVEYTYEEIVGGKGSFGMDSGFMAFVSPEYAHFYANTLANYDFLNIVADDSAGNGYLILTRNEYFNSSEYQDIVDLLEDRGFTLYHKHYPGMIPLDWETIYYDIRDEWFNTNHGFDYCLIIGDHDDITPAENVPDIFGERHRYSDYTYQCLEGGVVQPWFDWLPEINVGRLSVNDTDELGVVVDKLCEYEDPLHQGSEPWENEILMIAHKDDFCVNTKETISELEDTYPSETNISRMWGDGSGDYPDPTNQDIFDVIDDGVSLVNYLGHGREDRWRDWNLHDESFRRDEIIQLDNDVYPVVFNYSCSSGDIKYDGGDCLIESWLSETNESTGDPVGAIGTIGAPTIIQVPVANRCDELMFETIFTPMGIPVEYETIFGITVNSVTVQYMTKYGRKYTGIPIWPPGGSGPRRFFILGDPSMVIRVNTNYNKGGFSSDLFSDGENLVSSSFIVNSVYPNPTIEDMLTVSLNSTIENSVKIEVYDITGRIVSTTNEILSKGENLLDLNISSLSSGVYIIKVEDDNKQETKKFVVVR